MEIKIHGLHNLNVHEQQLIISSTQKLVPVFASTIWKVAIIHGRYSENRGYVGTKLYEYLLQGGDLRPDGSSPADQVMDLDITGFWAWSSTVGYTSLWALKTFINRKFLDKFTEAEVAGHVAHEYCHRLGFTHNFVKSTSVPYLVGDKTWSAFKEYYLNPPSPVPQPLMDVVNITFSFPEIA